MSLPVRLDLAHLYRESRFAIARGVRTRTVLGADPIPVIRDVDDGSWTRTGRQPPLFPKEGDPKWFESAARSDWPAWFEDGAVVRIRGGHSGPGSRAEGSKSIARIADVEKGPDLLRFRTTERVGDTA